MPPHGGVRVFSYWVSSGIFMLPRFLPGSTGTRCRQPDAVHDHAQPTRQRYNCLLEPAAPGDPHRPGLEPGPNGGSDNRSHVVSSESLGNFDFGNLNASSSLRLFRAFPTRRSFLMGLGQNRIVKNIGLLVPFGLFSEQ